MRESHKRTVQLECPYCSLDLTPDQLHICPAGCCFVDSGIKVQATGCPYCQETFQTSSGHVCLELIRLTEPAQ